MLHLLRDVQSKVEVTACGRADDPEVTVGLHSHVSLTSVCTGCSTPTLSGSGRHWLELGLDA